LKTGGWGNETGIEQKKSREEGENYQKRGNRVIATKKNILGQKKTPKTKKNTRRERG